MSETGLVQIIEGALLANGKAMTVTQLANLFEEHERPENAAIREALKEVAERCEDRGFELVEVASGFRFQVRQNLSDWIGRLWQERPQKYSRALLETLALIAYRQPITRGEIEEIRGVAVSTNIIKTLHERDWIRVVGHRDVPGRPAMYATTKQFLDYFNLKSLDQLPALAEIRDLETLNAELGFSEPVPEDAQPGGPELTVVGGTDHNPAGDEPETEDQATIDATGTDIQGEGSTDTAPDAEPGEAEGITLAEAAEELEARAAEPIDDVLPDDAPVEPEDETDAGADSASLVDDAEASGDDADTQRPESQA